MSSWLIMIIGFVYAYIAVDLVFKGDIGHGIAFAGYALGNVGLFITTHGASNA